PHLYLTSNETDYNLLFSDLLEFDSLYVKPLFGDCLWTTDEYVIDYLYNTSMVLRQGIL
ncbi:unnamed protein product, partial [Didymodactylos carnosus]